MRAKEFLMSVRSNKATIESLAELRDHYYDLAQKVTAHYGEQTGSAAREGNSSIEEYMIKALALQEDIQRELDKFDDRVRMVEMVIGKLEEEETIKILRMRYLNGWSWRKIEYGMHYSRQSLWIKHGKALEKVDEILREMNVNADAAEEDGHAER